MASTQKNFYFIRNKNVITGPFSREKLLELVRKKLLGPESEYSLDKLHFEPLSALFPELDNYLFLNAEKVPVKEPVFQSQPSPFDESKSGTPGNIQMNSNPLPSLAGEMEVRNGTMISNGDFWSITGHFLGMLVNCFYFWDKVERRSGAFQVFALLYSVVFAVAALAYSGKYYIPSYRWYFLLWGVVICGLIYSFSLLYLFFVKRIMEGKEVFPFARFQFAAAAQTLIWGHVSAALLLLCHTYSSGGGISFLSGLFTIFFLGVACINIGGLYLKLCRQFHKSTPWPTFCSMGGIFLPAALCYTVLFILTKI